MYCKWWLNPSCIIKTRSGLSLEDLRDISDKSVQRFELFTLSRQHIIQYRIFMTSVFDQCDITNNDRKFGEPGRFTSRKEWSVDHLIYFSHVLQQ